MRTTLNIPMEALLNDNDVKAWVNMTSRDFRPNQYQVKVEVLRTVLSFISGERAVYFTLRYLQRGQIRYSKQFKAGLGTDLVQPA